MVGLPLVLTWWAYDCHLCATKQEGHILDNSDGARCSSQAIARGILVGQRDALRNVSDFAEHANHGTLENRTFSCSQRWESYVVYFRLLSLVLRQLLCYRNFLRSIQIHAFAAPPYGLPLPEETLFLWQKIDDQLKTEAVLWGVISANILFQIPLWGTCNFRFHHQNRN